MGSMRVYFKVACGLDVHQAEVVACLSIQDAKGRVKQVTRRFRTIYSELVRLRDWLVTEQCEAVGWRRPATPGSRSIPFWKGTFG